MSHLAVLAGEPRPAGGAATGRARAYCASVLRGQGYEVTDRPFEFSALPGALGAPIVGAWSIAALVGVCAAGAAGRPVLALIILGVSGAVLAVGARALGATGVLSLPMMRRSAVNLEAVRAGASPRVWLVAHIDSKSQPVPMLLRALGAGLLVVCSGAALVLALEQWGAFIGPGAWWWLAALSAAAGLPVLVSWVGARSVGAVDNASGVAAVLAAAERLPADARVGVLITDGEELALAGARAWCRARAAPDAGGLALNCDSVDDGGILTVMTISRESARVLGGSSGGVSAGASKTGSSERRPDVAGALRDAAQAEAEPLRVIALLPGVLTDSVAFAAAGWGTATLSRGTLGTLRRIHTSADDLDHLRGTGIDGAARVLARAAMALADTPPVPVGGEG